MISESQALSGLVLAVGGLALVPLARRATVLLYPGRNVFFARWGFSHLALVLLAFLVFGQTVALIPPVGPAAPADVSEGAAAAGVGAGSGLSVVELLLRTELVLAACAALALRFAHTLHPEGFHALGLRPGRNGRAMATGALALLMMLPAIQGLALLWPWVYERLGGTYDTQAIVTGIGSLEGGALWVGIALAVVVAPFLEELLFRGFVQPLLVQNVGEVGGLVVTSILFAAVHGEPGSLVPLFAVSLVLGGVMLRTQRIAASWAAHALFNGVSLALLFAQPEAERLLEVLR